MAAMLSMAYSASAFLSYPSRLKPLLPIPPHHPGQGHETKKGPGSGASCDQHTAVSARINLDVDERHGPAGDLGQAAIPFVDGLLLHLDLAQLDQVLGHDLLLQAQGLGLGLGGRHLLLGLDTDTLEITLGLQLELFGRGLGFDGDIEFAREREIDDGEFIDDHTVLHQTVAQMVADLVAYFLTPRHQLFSGIQRRCGLHRLLHGRQDDAVTHSCQRTHSLIGLGHARRVQMIIERHIGGDLLQVLGGGIALPLALLHPHVHDDNLLHDGHTHMQALAEDVFLYGTKVHHHPTLTGADDNKGIEYPEHDKDDEAAHKSTDNLVGHGSSLFVDEQLKSPLKTSMRQSARRVSGRMRAEHVRNRNTCQRSAPCGREVQHRQYAHFPAEPAVSRPQPSSRTCLHLLGSTLCLLMVLFALPAQAELKSFTSKARQTSFLTADQAFRLETAASAEGLALTFHITPGYYLYLDRFRFSTEDAGLAIGQAVFASQGEWKDDPTFGRVKVFHENVELTLPLRGDGHLKVVWQGCADAGLCYPPQEQTLAIGNPSPAAAPPAEGAASPLSNGDEGSRLTQLFIMFALGLGLAFTPCVLPMLPILAGIIARQHTSSALRGFLLALAYVLGVGSVYAAMGFVVGLFGQQINLPGLFQHPAVLVVFTLLFFALALSLFGLYELRLPATLQSRFDAMSRRQQGGVMMGSFLIGVFSALVVSPCVSAPLFGVLLHISASGDAAFGALSLFLMALGMGVPLLVLGATEGRLLPKAGAWMHEVKFFFGLLLLFVAAELLTRMVPEPMALALYGLCTAATGFWLWRLGNGRALGLLTRALSFCALVYAAALVAGAASGGDDPLRPLAPISSQPHAATATPFVRVKNTAELDAEIAKATAEGKAVMLDFYADWCVSCKVMERHVFRKPDVAARMAKLHLVQADVTANNADDKALLKRFSLLGPPTIVFFDKNGNELTEARLVGEKNAPDFLAHLDKYGL